MKILFSGAYTINSAGDDAPLDTFLSILSEKIGNNNVEAIVLCRHPDEEFEKAFGVKTIQNLEYSSKEFSMDRWLRGFNFSDSQDVLLDLLKHFEAADLVVLGAGNIINEHSSGLFRGSLAQVCVNTFFANITDTPCLLYGVSATELNSQLSVYMANWLFKNVSRVTFREENSVDLLRKSGVNLAKNMEILPDPVLASSCSSLSRMYEILEYEKIPEKRSQPWLAISLREFYHRSKDFHNNYIRKIVKIVDSWTDNGGSVLLIPQCTYEFHYPYSDDRFVANELISLVKNVDNVYSIKSSYRPWDIEKIYSYCDIALCTRLHGGVFACKQGLPTVVLSYEPKVQGFWETIGLLDYCLSMDSSAELIIQKLEYAIHKFPKDEIATRIDSLKKLVSRYVDLAIELVEKKVYTLLHK